MPASKDEEEKESNRAAWLAALASLTGLVLVVVSVAAMRSGALFVVDRLVLLDAAWRGRLDTPPPVVTTRRIFEVLIFVGFLVICTSFLGIMGARTRHKSAVCTYVVFAAIFTVIMLAGGISTIQRKALVEPLIARQVVDLCNATTYIRLATQLRCKFAKSYAPSEITPCGVFCDFRANLLRQLQGCIVMPRLCEQFFYEEFRSGDCAAEIAQGGSAIYMASETSERCRQLCDDDIRCTAYAHSGAAPAKPERCLLGQGVAADHPPPRWSALAPTQAAEYLGGGGRVSCFRRTEPRVLERFRTHGTRLAVSTMVLGLVLTVSTTFSCCLMYNLNIKRRGRPTAAELALMLCCPCCARDAHRKFSKPQESDESDEEEEASSELGDSARSN
mmetsp:Transcript_45322/g.129385  ORF Transcript_45322/g.129385 Transcript_45322/m.129385 type:complete len:389 (+) Transcript_45322:85-1251(+)